jgi:hypothetical protein
MNDSDINNLKKIIIDIFEMVEYYRTEGNPEKLPYNINNFEIKKNSKEIYEAIDFFENYILNYNLYLYDMLSQEIFLKLLKTKKINGIDIILENKLNEIKNNYPNKEITSKIEYIITNSYKINSIKKLKELIEILKSLKVKDTEDLENLYFILSKLELIKKDIYTSEDINEILKFINKFGINNKEKLKSEIKEMITDKKNIDFIKKKYKASIENIKQYNCLDKVINYLDSLKN